MQTINILGLGGTTGTGKVVASDNATLTSPTFITPALGTPSSGDLSNCTNLPPATLVSLAVVQNTYTTGTISQHDFTVVGTGTTFDNTMVGGLITYPNGDTTTVIGFVDATTLTVTDNLTESDGSYTLEYVGLTGTKQGYLGFSGSLIYLANSANTPALTQPRNLGGFGILTIRGSDADTIEDKDGGAIRISGGNATGNGTGGNASLEGGNGTINGNAYVTGQSVGITAVGADGELSFQFGTGGWYADGGSAGSFTFKTRSTGAFTVDASSTGGIFLKGLSGGG